MAVTVLVDCILFKFLDGVGTSLFVSVISLILLLGVAQWLQVPWVVIHLEALLARLQKSKDKDSDETE
jgi:hypothetical protein